MASTTSRPGVAVDTQESPGEVRLPLLILALLALAAFALDAFAVVAHATNGLDLSVDRALQAVPWGPLTTFYLASDWLDGLKQVALAVIGVLLVAVLNRRGFFLMLFGALSAGAYTLLEMVVQRPRPEASLVHVLRHTSGYSFPSGHLVFYTWFLSYLVLILVRRHLPGALHLASWVIVAVLLALVAIGRVYSGEHWPSDVLAGLLLGTGWTLLGLSIRRLSDPVLNG
jgi:membrane-associated phospholipid phosphatase